MGVRGGDIGVGGGLVVGGGQGLAVELAIGGEGQGGEADEGGRDHVVGQNLAQGGAQVGGIGWGVRVIGNQVGDQAEITGAVLAGQDGGLANGGQAGEGDFDLAQFHPEAAQLDLEVGPSQVFNIAVGQPAGQVTGLVEAGAGVGGEGIGNELLGGELGAVPVAGANLDTADVQLGWDADGGGSSLGIEQVDPGVGDGAADGDPAVGGLAAVEPGHVDGTFGGAVEVVQLDLGQAGAEALDQVEGEGLAGAEGADQAGAGLEPRLVEEGLEHGGNEVEGGDALAADEVGQVGGVLVAFGAGEDQAGAGEEGPEELPDGDVEGKGGLLEDAVVGGEMEGVLHPEQAVDDGAVAVHGALGVAGGSGGVDDVGEVVGGGEGLEVGVGQVLPEVGVAVQADHLGVQVGQGGKEGLLGQEDRGVGVAEHEGEAVGGIGGVEGEVGGAGLEDGQEGDHQVEGAFHEYADQDVGAGAEATQVAGQAIGPGVELGVGEGVVAAGQGGGVGGQLDLAFDQLVEAGVDRELGGGGVEIEQDLVALGAGHEGQGGDRGVGVIDQGLEQDPEVVGHAGDGVRAEQVGVVFEIAGQAAGGFGEAQGQVELGDGEIGGQGLDLEAGGGGRRSRGCSGGPGGPGTGGCGRGCVRV